MLENTQDRAWKTGVNTGRTVSSSHGLRRASTALHLMEAKWDSVQVGRQGSYSIERLESLDHFCRTKSTTHVILVCLLTPLPALGSVLILESLPLQPPGDGWAANWVLWIRLSSNSFLVNVNAMLVFRRLVPGLQLTLAKILAISTVVGAGFSAFSILLAVVVGFPVPFVSVVGSTPASVLIGLMLVLMFGVAPFRSTSPLRPNLVKFGIFLVPHVALITVYPLVKVLYAFVPARYQGVTMLLLPLWKFGAKKYVGRSVNTMEDFVPGIVAFTVDFFSTLFVSVCMYSSGSAIVSVLAILTDVLLSLLEYRDIRHNADILYKLLQDHKSWSYNHLSHQESESLLSLTLEVARNPEAFNIESVAGVRLWACDPHPLPSDRFDALKRLETLHVYSSTSQQSVTARVSTSLSLSKQLRSVSVVPATAGPVVHSLEKSPLTQSSRLSINAILTGDVGAGAERSKKLIVQGLQLLFHCEYLVLVEYIECVIPLVFVVYKSVLQQLPNVVYAPGGVDGWRDSAVGGIMLFAILEVFSFIALKVLLQRKFAFSPLYQLAYVLETQAEFVQVDVFIATLVLLPCELQHFGMDFSLRFDWL